LLRCATNVPVHRDLPERSLQTPRPIPPETVSDPDAYFCPTLTEARTAPDEATWPLNVRMTDVPFTTSTVKL
jgi:hypothetical protein